MGHTYIRFDANPAKILARRAHFVVDHGGAEPTTTPDERYKRAVPILWRWRHHLVALEHWRVVHPTNAAQNILYVLKRGLAPASRASDALTRNNNNSSSSSAGWSACPRTSSGGAVLALPVQPSAFFEYRTLLKDIFQDPHLFHPYLDSTRGLVPAPAASSALTNIFYLLQLLFPGMLLIVHDMPTLSLGSGSQLVTLTLTRMRRAMPPVEWIRSCRPMLEEMFGQACVRAFLRCARDPACVKWTTYIVPSFLVGADFESEEDD